MDILETEVAVIGAGIAGLVAATGAAEAGLRVLVLEQSPDAEYICSSRITGGVFHCALNAPDRDPEALAAVLVGGRGADGNAGLARQVARDVLPAIRWLQSQGARFIRASADPWQRFVIAPPSLGRPGDGWRGRGGDRLLRQLEARLESYGGKVLHGRRATRLLGDAAAGIAGVGGDSFEIHSFAVVIADGGFQQNAERLRAAISPRPERLVQRNGGTGWGDGIAMAEAAGAALEADLRGFYGHVVSRDALEREDMRFYPWLDELARHGIAVTADGHRFCDESLGGIHVANRIAALTDPASATVVWDEAIWRGPGRSRFMAVNPALEKRGATLFRANSLGELAAAAGIDPDGLVATVEVHNAAVLRGGGAGLVPARTIGDLAPLPIARPPFYAAPAAAGLTYTMGGLKVDALSRVVAREGGVFPNLFAVGGTSGGLEGGEKPLYAGGLVKAAATGWRAARTLIEHLRVGTVLVKGPTKDQ